MNILIIDLLGLAVLLMWGLRMVRTGITRAFGARLRHALAVSTSNRFKAFVAGLLATLALQSSTATSLLTASFASRAYVSTGMAMAIMLGANVGTAIMAKILSWDVHWLSSLFIIGGFCVFSVSSRNRAKAIGRAFIGLGIMLIALHLIGAASDPMRQSPIVRALLLVLNQAPIAGFFLSAVMTILTASSLPILFLIISLISAGTIDAQLTLYLVFGANVGGAVVPMVAATGSSVAKRVPVGNLGVRLAGFAATLPFAGPISSYLQVLTGGGATFVFDCHLLINTVLAIVFLPFVGTLGCILDRIFPAPALSENGPKYLDDSCLDSPSLALACAARETMRVGDRIEAMLLMSMKALQINDVKLCDEIGKMDDEVDDLQEAIKLYLAKLGRDDPIDESDAQRATEIISFAINLEHIGDIIDKSLRELAEKKIKHHATFSREGAEEMEEMFMRTRENLRAAQSVLISQNVNLARRLVEEKVKIRHIEQSSAENHLQRLRAGRIESLQTSTIHLDVMRDLKRINSHIISVAYPVLELAGELREDRLKPATGSDGRAQLNLGVDF